MVASCVASLSTFRACPPAFDGRLIPRTSSARWVSLAAAVRYVGRRHEIVVHALMLFPALSMAALAALVSLLTVFNCWAFDGWLWRVTMFWVMFWPRKAIEPHTMAKIIQPRAAPVRTRV